MSEAKRIRILDESLAKKIAAGEVVERPSSVVKELVENALDAGSSFITIEIEKGGKQLIRVTDNGHGIKADDMELAFLRHATSKIRTTEDLYNIAMMGFRGEALYSISAVSKVTLISKPPYAQHGYATTLEGGVIKERGATGCPDGTCVLIEDLFFNTPARLKFLKSDAAETAQVGNIIQRFILSHPSVSFKFINNGKVIYQSSGDGSLKNAIYSIYGMDVAKNVVEFKDDGIIKVSGCIGKRPTFRSNRNHQSLFINHRYIKDAAITSVVEQLYGSLLMKRTYPFYIINIDIAPGLVDVNVHPQKLVVRFSDPNAVRSAIHSALSPMIQKLSGLSVAFVPAKEETIKVKPKRNLHNFERQSSMSSSPRTIPKVTSEESEKLIVKSPMQSIPQVKVDTPKAVDVIPQPKVPPKPIHAEKVSQNVVPGKREGVTLQPKQKPDQSVHHYNFRSELNDRPKEKVTLRQKPALVEITQTEVGEIASFVDDPIKASIVGQAFNAYVVIEKGESLYIIDQHAAHERLLYEQMMEAMKKKDTANQQLLIPQMIDLAYDEKVLLDEHRKIFEDLGFEIEEYGRLSYQIRAVPFILGQPQVKGFFREALDRLIKNDHDLKDDDSIRNRIITAACKKAVKAGDKLTINEVETLLKFIEDEKVPLTCPHGRPFVMVIEKHELNKRFGRTH